MSIQSNFPALKPSLLLDFSNTEALDSRVTFTRASTATYYGTQTAKAEENLLLQSQTFETSWPSVFATVTANTTTAPDGTTTADTITDDATSATHRISQTFSANTNTPYVLSCFLKAGTATHAYLSLTDTTNVQRYFAADFDLSAGAVRISGAGTSGTFTSASITESPAGSGWYRCVVIGEVAAVSASTRAVIGVSDGTTAFNTSGLILYVGTGSTVFAWGAQLEQRSAVTAYTATTTQPITNYIPVLQTAASGVARFDHNPTTFESLGLLIEEQRTNLQIQSEDFTTSWVVAAASIQSNTLVAPNGTLTADKLVEDTANAWHYVGFFNITPTTATPYTLSCYAKKGEREFVQLYLPSTAFGDSNSTNGAVFNLTTGAIAVQGSALTSASITSVGNGWYRCTITKTSTSTTAFPFVISVRNAGTFSTAGYTGDGYSGIYIWGAQLEAGAFPTSYVATVASQVTRAADAASMTGTNFSSWYNQAEGTLYAEASAFALGSFRIASVSDGTSANRILLNAQFNGGERLTVVTNNVSVGSVANGAYTANQVFKQIAAYKTDDFALSVNGAAATTDTSGVLPVVNQANIGAGNAGTSPLSGHIRKIAYYPVRIQNNQLQALTS